MSIIRTDNKESHMLCLSIRQPYAWAIVEGVKRIENRSWKTAHRGRILIHAGISPAEIHGTRPADWQAKGMPTLDSFDKLAYRGFILGSVRIVDIVPVEKINPFLRENHGQKHFASGPLCWLLADPIKFTSPIPMLGKLSLFQVEDSILPEVR